MIIKTELLLWSSSSWGCELKYQAVMFRGRRDGHPLREDVSWNVCTNCGESSWPGHPLREDVSWNNSGISVAYLSPSSSSWGCELKSFRRINQPTVTVILFVRMWVEILLSWKKTSLGIVILFVRMWVEIPSTRPVLIIFYVILFVRMWVEMLIPTYFRRLMRHPLREDVSWNMYMDGLSYWTAVSSSSWGCELKY